MSKRLLFSELFVDLQDRGVISKKRQRRDSSDSSTDNEFESRVFPTRGPGHGTGNEAADIHVSSSNSSTEAEDICHSVWVPDSDEGVNKENCQPSSQTTHHSETTAISLQLLPAPPLTNVDNHIMDHQSRNKRVRTIEAKKRRDIEKHPLRPPCQCKRKCCVKIDQDRRVEIHKLFWEKDYMQRRAWIFSYVKVVPKKRAQAVTVRFYDRNSSRIYTLPQQNGEDKVVCKTFFLNTLGFTSDKIITVTLTSAPAFSLSPPCDKRGKHEPKHKMSETDSAVIENHINSFNPSISHYRRAHAPHRKYLPPELSVRDMYKDFVSKKPDVASYETYRRVIKIMNISFVKLGEEECEDCVIYEKHEHNMDENDECQLCTEWKQHIECARVSRKNYQIDANKESTNAEKYFSVDMQKVIMLPRMPGVKSCVFTRRLVLFHQTFAPLETKRGANQEKPTGVIWHEAVSGRNAEDVTSAYSNIIHHPRYRDCQHFVFWTDNCTAQNKNWTLYTAMVNEVNLAGGPQSVTIKYLEKGHTFMSADSFHAQVEKGLRAVKNIYDLNDFENVISKIGNVISLEHANFRQWENGVSQGKFTSKPRLSSVHSVKFIRGSGKMYWKSSLDDQEFQSGDFLKKKLLDRLLKGNHEFMPREKPRGVTEIKKSDIIKKLCPLMPANRVQFWNDLPIDEDSPDLIDCN